MMLAEERYRFTQFAEKAMQGLLSNQFIIDEYTPEEVAERSFNIAEAMMKELKKRTEK